MSSSVYESQKQKLLSVLETAAKENNVDSLYETIRENPKILKEIEDTPFADTPLHVAASHGNTIFAAEMMSLTPSFSRKLNCEGLSPLHLALQNGHLETAREMIDLEGGLVRVPGRGKMTPMHSLVSMIGNGDVKKVDLLIDFLWASPEAVTDVTVEGKTPLHIAVASKSVDAFKVLFGWVCRTGQKSGLDKHDIDGNNLMHLAALTDQTEVMRRLKGFVSLTKENKQGLTPADITTERGQGNTIVKILKNNKQEKNDISNEYRRTFFMSQETFVQEIIRFIAQAHRGMSMEKRNMILVVATLVATAAYQVVLQPPSGIAPVSLDHTTMTPKIIRANFFGSSMSNRSKLFNVFVPLNTLALNLSLALILFVFPLDLGNGLLQLTLLAMSGSYITVMEYILGKHRLPLVLSEVIYTMFGVALGVQLGVYLLRHMLWKYSNFNLQIETVLRSPALATEDNKDKPQY